MFHCWHEVRTDHAELQLFLGEDSLWVDNIAACQARCGRTKGCAHFTYWRDSRGCLLQNASAEPVHDPNSTAGPRRCARQPHVGEPSDRELESPGVPFSLSDWLSERIDLILMVALPCCVLPAVLFVVFMLWKRRKKRRRAPPGRSRPEEAHYHEVSQDSASAAVYQPMRHEETNLPSPASPSYAQKDSLLGRASPGGLTTGQYATSQGGYAPNQGNDSGLAQFLRPEHLGVQVDNGAPVPQATSWHSNAGSWAGHAPEQHPVQHSPMQWYPAHA